ncbi:MAG: LysM domain-containing protein [Desulfosporosinus sp.]|nr:LysM domain-containing protein [Desulfosporosinus sp.]
MHYVIQPGDSLHSIAMNYGTTVRSLMDLNPQIGNPHQIYPGERILVSSGYQWNNNRWDNNRWDNNRWDRNRWGSNRWEHGGSNKHHDNNSSSHHHGR